MVVGKSPDWLPPGFIEKVRHKNGRKIKEYSEQSSGRKFYSKAAVARYLNTLDHDNTTTVQNKIENVDKSNVHEHSTNEPSTVTSVQLVPMTNTGDNKPNVDEPSTVMSPQLVSMTNTGGINKMKRKNSSYTEVVTERSTDDDLPPGWIKEIKISKSGSKMRRDPFYTDPVSGYVFRSKKDAMRYLETNDISQCASKPFKRELELDDIKNEISSSNPANEKLPEHKQLGGELTGGEEPSGKAEAEMNISKEKQVQSDNVEVEDNNTPGPESENRPQKNKKKKRKGGLSLPARTSKRLSGSQPEIVNLSEHSLRAAARSSVKIPNFEPVPEEETFKGGEIAAVPEEETTFQGNETQVVAVPEEETTFEGNETQIVAVSEEEETFKGNEDRLREIVENLFNDIEEPQAEGPPPPEGQSKQIDETRTTQESQLCYNFGDSWSDPLEFAFKTLMGEISIDDPLTFPSCFSEPHNQAHNESSKQVGPSSSSLGDASSNEVGKKDFLNKFNP